MVSDPVTPEDEHDVHDYLRAIARECRCCPDCWDVPCGACQAGGVCDDICNCHDPEHDGSADELDEEDES